MLILWNVACVIYVHMNLHGFRGGQMGVDPLCPQTNGGPYLLSLIGDTFMPLLEVGDLAFLLFHKNNYHECP